MPVEKMRRPTWSLGLNWPRAWTAACLARSSLLVPLPALSPIEPDTSITSSTRAGLRSWPHFWLLLTSTAGAGVVAIPVVEERERGVAVVNDRRLDGLGRGVDVRTVEVLDGQVSLLAGRRVVLGDRRVQGARGEVGVGLAELERAPLRVPVS